MALGVILPAMSPQSSSALSDHRARYRLSMEGKCVRISYDEMMKRYVPNTKAKAPHWITDLHPSLTALRDGLLAETGEVQEKEMYEPLSETINSWLEGTGFKLVITYSQPNPEDFIKQRIDSGIYKANEAPDTDETLGSSGKDIKWEVLEAGMEVKRSHKSDPFSDKDPNFVHASDEGQKALAQILSHSSLTFVNQHRTHHFTLLILGTEARIVRWDRSGVSFTETFNYFKHPKMLGEFIWRYAHMTDAQRGHDTTVERILSGTGEYDLMTRRANIPRESKGHALDEHIRKRFKEKLDDRRYKFHIGEGDQRRSFLVGQPQVYSTVLAGRGTRGYIAIDTQYPNGPFVFLKDTWRLVTEAPESEGTILETLNEAGKMEFRPTGIPTLICHGDVGGQETDSQNLWKKLNPEEEEEKCPLRTHHHYRLVVKEVGLPVTEFSNGREMIYLILHAIKAHEFAYKKDFIHRDISAGNVLIFIEEKIGEEGKLSATRRALLTDWELAKRASQQERTGTWQFLSEDILSNPRKPVEIAHEMESFFHLIIWLAIHYLPHNRTNVEYFVISYFDDHQKGPNGKDLVCGEVKRLTMQLGRISSGTDEPLTFYCEPNNDGILSPSINEDGPSTTPIQQRSPHPINAIIDILLSKFRSRYALIDPRSAPKDQATRSADANYPKDTAMDPFSDLGIVPEPVTNSSVMSSAQREEQQKDVEQLQQHDRFFGLIYGLTKDPVQWPLSDKVELQLPDDPGPESLPSSAVNGKRTHETMSEGDGPQDPPPKNKTRRRTAAQPCSTQSGDSSLS